jgi:trk system potassium uptake protein TrkH
MGWFDALCHGLTSLATGGFSTRSASIGAFGPAVQWVVVACMVVGGINFVLHYRWLTGRGREVLRDAELRMFAATAGVLIVSLLWVLHRSDLGTPVREVVFQVVSLLTTAGFVTADYERWPQFAQLLILPLFALGGMAGSTTGGLKTMRALLGLRMLRAALARIVHPHAVRPVRYDGQAISPEVVSALGVFFLAFLGLTFLGALVVGSAGYDLLTALIASLTAVANVGPGLGSVGPTETFAPLPGYVKLALCFNMIAGRLEIFTLLVIFSPAFWRR